MLIHLLKITTAILTLKNVQGQIDFAQFHLPPCCYLAQHGTPDDPVLDSPFFAPSKREVSTQILARENSHSSENGFSKRIVKRDKLYSLIVPLSQTRIDGNKISVKQRNLSPNLANILVPEAFKNRTDGNNLLSAAATQMLQTVITDELDNQTFESKRMARRSSATSEEISPQQELLWDSKREGRGFKMRLPELDYSQSENQQKELRQIPTSWVKYLRRALYQSITDGRGLVDTGIESKGQNGMKPNSRYKIRFPDIWKAIKTSQVFYVDKMSRSSPSPFSPIYLPVEQGPIISGVLVNMPDGIMHIRVSTELNSPGSNERQLTDCLCNLINPGEILLAYWTIGRIFKDDGQPALQYLVYPLPHSVPTPPELMQFGNDGMFLPSPVDDLANSVGPAQFQGPILGNALPPRESEVIRNQEQQLQLDGGNNNTPPLDQTIGSLPPFNGGNENGLNNFPAGLQQQYPQDFNNILSHQVNDPNNNLFYQSIPYSDLNTNGPVNYELPGPSPQVPADLLLPPSHGSPQRESEVPQNPLENPGTYPASIQDIISPHSQAPPLQPPSDFQQPQPQPLISAPEAPTRTPIVPIPTHLPANHPPSPLPFIPEYPFYAQYPPNIPISYFPINGMYGGIIVPMHNQQQIKQNNPPKNKSIKTKISKPLPTKTAPPPPSSPPERLEDNLPPPKHSMHRPYIVSNILDNERRYYPVRRYHKAAVKYFEKYRRKNYQKLINDIDNINGYILDF